MTDDKQAQNQRPDDNGDARRPGDPGPELALARHLDLDTLQAYLDQDLTDDGRQVAAGHLARCADCWQELSELRATVTLLRGLPHYAPRRSFQLSPEYAPRAAASGSWLDRFRFAVPALPALRAATVAVAVLLVAVTVGNFVADQGADTVQSPAVQDAAPEEAEEADAAFEAAPAPAPADEEQAASVEEVAAGDGGTNDDAPALGRERVQAPAAEPSLAREAGQPPPPRLTVPAGAIISTVPPVVDGSGGAAGGAPLTAEDGPSGWRLAQFGLGLLLLWLIVSVVGLQRLRRREVEPDAPGVREVGNGSR